MDKFQEIKEYWKSFFSPYWPILTTQNELKDIEWLIQEVERLRTIEQSYEELKKLDY
ncbi:hypothetical protein ACIQD3_22580 [Peribacillus loiseleuriae]|uniref:hypothetical protein n=1 Tax=Peribacillus loiseleuriae TaxID=1679170 RepID=UPI003816B3A0